MTLFSVRWMEKGLPGEHIITTDNYDTVSQLVDMLKNRDLPCEIMNLTDHMVSFQHVLTVDRVVTYQGAFVIVRGTVPGLDMVYLSHPDGGDKLDIMVRHHTIIW